MAPKGVACVVLVGLALWTSPIFGGAANEKASAPVAPAEHQDTSAAVSVTEIAAQGAIATESLRTLASQLAPSAEIETIRRALPEASRLIELEMAGTSNVLRAQPSLATIAAQQELWKERQLQTTKWLNVLTQRATRLQGGLSRLAELQARWTRTQEAAEVSKVPAPVLQQVADLLVNIAAAQAPLQAQLSVVLDLQSRVAEQVARCGTVLAEIAQAQEQAMGGILVRDSAPIWNPEAWVEWRSALRQRLLDLLVHRWNAWTQYARDPSQGAPLHLGSFLVLVGVFRAARRRAPQWTAAGQEAPSVAAVVSHPYAGALIVPLVLASAPVSLVPPTLRQVFEVCALVPAILLTRQGLGRRTGPWLYVLVLLFLVDTGRQNLAGISGVEQVLLTLEMLVGIAALGHALTRGRARLTVPPTLGDGTLLPAIRAMARLVLGAFSVAVVMGVLGYMRLGRLLAAGVLSSGALALTLYACFLAVNGLVGFALRVWPLQSLQMVRHFRDLLERRTSTVLRWCAVGAWAARTLDYVGLFQPFLAGGASVLSARFERGTVSLSLGDMVEFILVVWLAYLASAFVRFALQEDVFPRFKLPRGTSYALSSLLNYVFIALGFLLGLGVLGLELTKVTVLAGAFGVGIGFGLQGVVNNFVSGLILLFERPFHVGDIVQVGEVVGEVVRIGMRASTVRTVQGAEIIVPNAQLVTDQLTNWTLSDRTRRIELPVGVNYGAPPAKVIELLEAVARAHPGVLPNPPPKAFFTGFGDSAISFELRTWTAHFEQWYQIRSDLAVAVHSAIREAGLSFPFPQREVRLLRDPENASGVTQGVPSPAAGDHEGTAEPRSV